MSRIAMRCLIAFLTLTLVTSTSMAGDDSQISKDAVVAQALVRLDGIDLAARPDAKAAVIRHLRRNPDSDEFTTLVGKYELSELSDLLILRAAVHCDETQGVEAARLLVRLMPIDELKAAVEATAKSRLSSSGETPVDGRALLTALGRTNHAAIRDLAIEYARNVATEPAIRRVAITAVGRTEEGKKQLLALLEKGRFADDLHVVLGSTLMASTSDEVRQRASALLALPKIAGNDPLPPLPDLVKLRGDIARGAAVFRNEGTCIKCHQVGSEGKPVGPNLSEIGGKLAREAMYVSILDPNAAISFNYEMTSLLLEDGSEVSGVVISDTDASVTIRNAEAIERTVPRAEIDEMDQQRISLMPTGLVQSLTKQQLVDLVEYLMSLKANGS